MAASEPTEGPREDNGPDQSAIAYCGLCCFDCPISHGQAADLAAGLLEQLRDPAFRRLLDGLPKVIEGFDVLSEHPQCSRFLEALKQVHCTGFCRLGGGTSDCPIRACCTGRQLEGCWMCDELGQCVQLAWLKPVHGDRHLQNLHTIRQKGKEAFLQGKRHW